MPIGKYIYCTNKKFKGKEIYERVTNAYRQVHLLYFIKDRKGNEIYWRSQMPIGKYIFCTQNYIAI